MLIRLAMLLILTSMSSGLAAETIDRGGACLTPTEVDAALREGEALRFAEVAHRSDGEIVRAELCRNAQGLVYRVTLVDPRGSVRRVLIDARSGRLVYDGR